MKRYIAILIMLVLIISTAVVESFAYDDTLSAPVLDLTTASDWAVDELQEAASYGLITDRVLGDYKQNITREQFSGLAVKLYEALSNKKAEAAEVNPFIDTKDMDILKANKLGIVNGKAPNLFMPQELITRQELSVMIVRALKAAFPNIVINTAGAENFSDKLEISDWALESVNFCNANGIMKNVGDGRINPIGFTTREQAIMIVKRVYEKYKSQITANTSIEEDWPELIKYPRPFEEGYFSGFENAELVASKDNIDVIAVKESISFEYPLDPFVARTLMVYNNGDTEAVVEYFPTIDIINYDPDLFINHPQPSALYLEPGESHPIRLIYTLQTGGPSVPNWEVGDEIYAPFNVKLTIRRPDKIAGEEINLKLDNTVVVKEKGGPNFSEPKANAAISGTVYDGATGKALSNIFVSVFTGRTSIDTRTDAQGKFSIPVYAHKRGAVDQWSEFVVGVNNSQDNMVGNPPNFDTNPSTNEYGQSRRVVTVEAGQNINMDYVIKPVTKTASYEVESILDIGLQAYGWDATEDGEVMATVPFHTTYPKEILNKESYLTVFNYKGELLWKYPIYGETPTVDVSTDGSMIATTLQAPKTGEVYNSGGIAVLVFSKEGEQLLRFDVPETKFWWGAGKYNFTVVQISEDNRYVAAGDGMGRLFLIEIESGKVMWETFTKGQVRRLRFNKSDELTLYASSGDGYLRAYDIDGNIKWKTYTDSWSTDMDMSENYIIITSKSNRAAVHLIDKATGNIAWSYPTENRGSGVFIAPDESFVWYGTDIGGGSTPLKSTVYNAEGLPLFDMIDGQSGAVTADSEYIAVKNGQQIALYDRNGELLWKKNAAIGGAYGSLNHILWISPDGSRIVAGLNNRTDGQYYGQIYFLKGGIQEK